MNRKIIPASLSESLDELRKAIVGTFNHWLSRMNREQGRKPEADPEGRAKNA